MTGLFFVQKWRFFFKHLPILQKKQYFYNPVSVSLAILMQIKKFFFLFQLQICGGSSACRKKKHAAGEWLQCRHFEIFVSDKISLET